ncbi:MAG: L-seryl-tRNA(Ser) seleniumtransferase [Thermoleophilaceae bacterium]|nr:L-seryl-tRNA(Ser) seleniumtransferase [Thermoleophilaceae bacterium]
MAKDAGSRAPGPDLNERLRELPSVEELAALLEREGAPHAPAVEAAREAIDARREAIRTRAGGSTVEAAGSAAVLDDARQRLADRARPRLRPVLNATGVIVHTNLGRAPLPGAALDAVRRVGAGYSNLEYDLERGARGSRQAHAEELLCDLTGAEAALVVNNCAAAVLLAAAALAEGRDLIVSRGQLVEIGGSFRVPDVVARSGARLVEVGTTNRTTVADYERAISAGTGALLRAHQSNFRTVGFVADVEIEDLCELAARAGVPVIDDLGSGALAERVPELAEEPAVRRSVAAGAAVACFSGDKLLGGPQAGVMVGSAAAIERCRSHPLARALRIDKLSLAALEATLALYRDPATALREVPVLRMLTAGEAELRPRAELMCERVAAAGIEARVIDATARVGGGALPLLELAGPVCAVDPGSLGVDELARRLRAADPPVVARAREGWLLLDPRTLDDEGAGLAAAAVVSAVG